jgi:myosin I
VVGPGKGERNFHIFYQMTKSCTPQEKENLGMMEPKYFRYLNVSGEYNADGINDAEEYQAMKASMNVCKIPESSQTSIFQILAAILHLGNITFVPAENGNDAQVQNLESLSQFLFSF